MICQVVNNFSKKARLRTSISDVYILVKEKINLKTVANNNIPKKNVVLKNKAPFRSCITKINFILIDNA